MKQPSKKQEAFRKRMKTGFRIMPPASKETAVKAARTKVSGCICCGNDVIDPSGKVHYGMARSLQDYTCLHSWHIPTKYFTDFMEQREREA